MKGKLYDLLLILFRRVAGTAVLSAFLFAVTGALAGPITSSSALPVDTGGLIFRGQGKLIRASDDPSPMDRDLTVWAAPTVLVYGVNQKFAVFSIFPYLHKSLELNTPAGRLTRGDAGIGDFRFLFRCTIGQWDRPQETLRLAPFVGLEIPSGNDNASDALGVLPATLQLGSGSWDPIIGTVFSWQTLPWEFDVSASYKINSEANNFDFGDEARLDFSFQYRLLPKELGQGAPSFLYGVIESALEWRGRNEMSGNDDPNSGGTVWYIAPGIQYVTTRMVFEVAVQIPVVQNLHGNSLKTDFILTTGFRFNF